MRFLNKEEESVVQDNNLNLLSLLTTHFKSFNKVKTRKTTEHDQYNNNVKYGCSSSSAATNRTANGGYDCWHCPGNPVGCTATNGLIAQASLQFICQRFVQ